MENKNSKIMFSVLAIAIILIILVGITYAFFNYTRTGSGNIIKTGRIYFNSEQGTSINLTNMFPIDVTDGVPNDNTKVGTVTINVVGDTDYSGGIEYLIRAVDVYNTVGIGSNQKSVPISVEVSYSANGDGKVIGVLDQDYFTNRGGNASLYKILAKDEIKENDQLVVGYIASGETGIDGNIQIRAYLDASKIAISDTYDGEESDNNGTTTNWVNGRVVLTTSEWNSLQANGVSFKIKVEANEGIWVSEPLTLTEAISRKVSTVNYIASYDDIITQNPTFTTQDQVSTNATKQTVYYFTGNNAAANANVLFAGYCWQIIRTTDNGGVRMIYNGVAVNNKCETTRTATKGINGTIGTSTSLSAAALFGRSYDYDLDTGVFTLQDSTGLPTSWNDTNYKDLIGTYTCKSSLSTCTTLYYVGSYASSTNAYTTSYTIGDVAHFSELGTSAFNPNYYSPALVGYMFNTEYDYKLGSKSGEYYTNAVWENGAYVLSNGNSGTAPDVTHHYICDSDCTKVRYYYYVSGSSYYYILLENGKTVEDALKEMINYKANENDLDENINVYNSAMKGYLDNWYKKNLTAYASYLDSATVYCNDRSIRDLGGWNPSGTSLTGYLQFKQYSTNKDLNCVKETDRFAVTNSKAELTYPIGLLTEPERNLMTANFAKTGRYYWGASPHYFSNNTAVFRAVDTTGDYYSTLVYVSFGARAVISLRPSTKLEDGTGTYTDPYIVGPIVERSE